MENQKKKECNFFIYTTNKIPMSGSYDILLDEMVNELSNWSIQDKCSIIADASMVGPTYMFAYKKLDMRIVDDCGQGPFIVSLHVLIMTIKPGDDFRLFRHLLNIGMLKNLGLKDSRLLRLVIRSSRYCEDLSTSLFDALNKVDVTDQLILSCHRDILDEAVFNVLSSSGSSHEIETYMKTNESQFGKPRNQDPKIVDIHVRALLSFVPHVLWKMAGESTDTILSVLRVSTHTDFDDEKLCTILEHFGSKKSA